MPDELYHDIGKICSFLSRRDSVLANLAPLNAAIKKELEKPVRKQLSDRMEEALRKNSGQPLRNDTGKLLSGILDEFETPMDSTRSAKLRQCRPENCTRRHLPRATRRM